MSASTIKPFKETQLLGVEIHNPELIDRDAEGEVDDNSSDTVLSDSELTDRDADGETDDGSYETAWSPRSESIFGHPTTTATTPESAPDDSWTDEDAEGEPDDGNYETVVPVGDGSYLYVPFDAEDGMKEPTRSDGCGLHNGMGHVSEDDCASDDETFVSGSEAYDGGDEMNTDDKFDGSFNYLSPPTCPSLWRTPSSSQPAYVQFLSFNDGFLHDQQ